MSEGVRKILLSDSWECTGTVGNGKENKNATTSLVALFAACVFFISQGISTIKHCLAFFLSLSFQYQREKERESEKQKKHGFSETHIPWKIKNGRATMLIKPRWSNSFHFSPVLTWYDSVDQWSLIIHVCDRTFAPCSHWQVLLRKFSRQKWSERKKKKKKEFSS